MGGGAVRVQGQEVRGKSLYLLLHTAVNLKLLKKIKSILKKETWRIKNKKSQSQKRPGRMSGAPPRERSVPDSQPPDLSLNRRSSNPSSPWTTGQSLTAPTCAKGQCCLHMPRRPLFKGAEQSS